MNELVIQAAITSSAVVLSCIITAYVTNRTSTKLIEYRLDLLEEKLDKHNDYFERTAALESSLKRILTALANLEARQEK